MLMSFAVQGSFRDRSWVLVRVGWLSARSELGCAGCGLSFLRGDGRIWELVAQGGLDSGSVAVVVCGVGGLPCGAGCRPLGALFWGGPPVLDCRWLGAGSVRRLVCLPVGAGGAGGIGWGLPLVVGGWGRGVVGRGLGFVGCVFSLALSFV